MSHARTATSDGRITRSADEIKAYLVAELAKAIEVNASTIDTAAPLLELGVDSLMALGMAGGLAAWLDRDVPATLLWDYPTINDIAAGLATAAPGPHLPKDVALLQSEGDGTPLFCFPGLAGTPIAFRALAAELGPGHKVYGLAVPGYDGTTESFNTVEEIAAAMLRAVRQVQPKGPYMLAGHCFGGFLALDAARQLLAAGETVSLLAIYDAFTRDGRVFKPAWRRLITHGYLIASGKVPLSNVVNKLKPSFLKKKLKPVANPWAQPVLREGDPAQVIWKVNSAALSKYYLDTYPGSLVFFKATERAVYDHFFTSKPCGGWSDLAQGRVDVVQLPGNHGSIIAAEHAAGAAAALRPYLDCATTRMKVQERTSNRAA